MDFVHFQRKSLHLKCLWPDRGLPSNTRGHTEKGETIFWYFRQIVLALPGCSKIYGLVYFDFALTDRLQQNLKENDDVWEKLRQRPGLKGKRYFNKRGSSTGILSFRSFLGKSEKGKSRV